MQRFSLLVCVVFCLVICCGPVFALVDEHELERLLQAETSGTKTKTVHAIAPLVTDTEGSADPTVVMTTTVVTTPAIPAVDMNVVVARMRDQGLTTATSVGTFRPDDTISKQVMAKFASLFAVVMKKQRTTNPNCGFKDIYKAQQDFVPYLLSACSMSLMKGANGYAAPTKNLTKAEAVVIIMRILKNDIKPTGDIWYKAYYDAARAYGITYGSLGDMENVATKGEVAIMMWRAYKVKN